MEVHKFFGYGFLEAVYQEALRIELQRKKIPFENEKRLKIHYKGLLLHKEYVADLVCYNKIIAECKAVNDLSSVHTAQMLNYLKITGYRLGIIVNFGQPSLQYKRIIL